MKKRVKTWFCVVGALCCGLCLSRAQDFTCTVAQNHDKVIYRISDESRPADYNASKCSYFWMNDTGHTIATKTNKMSSLLESSINNLTASGCIGNIICKQYCISEMTGFGKDFMANCTISCSRNSLRSTDGLPGLSVWIVFGVMILIVLVVVGLVLLCRNNPLSSCRRYGPVRRHDNDQPVHV